MAPGEAGLQPLALLVLVVWHLPTYPCLLTAPPCPEAQFNSPGLLSQVLPSMSYRSAPIQALLPLFMMTGLLQPLSLIPVSKITGLLITGGSGLIMAPGATGPQHGAL